MRAAALLAVACALAAFVVWQHRAHGVAPPPPPEPAPSVEPLATPRVLLVPDLRSWQAALASAQERSASAAALADATLTSQNAFAAGPATCADPTRGQAALRAETFGVAWRDELQGVRAALQRLEQTAAAPTIAPILGPADREALASLRAATEEALARYLDAAALQETDGGAWLARCGVPDLALSPGAPAAVSPPLVPVILRDPGVLVPLGVPAEPGVVLLREPGAVCLASATDASASDTSAGDASPGDAPSCTPRPIAPGSVLGVDS